MRNPDSHSAAKHAMERPQGRGARLLIDLDSIEGNIRVIAGHVPPGTRVMAVVKASGYGHGGPLVAQAAMQGGATWLGVATVDEGFELRAAGIEAPILVLGPTGPWEAHEARGAKLHITIGAVEQLDGLLADAGAGKDPLGVHLKINTGMNRYGIDPGDVAEAASVIARCRGLSLEGVLTHLARADEAGVPEPTATQQAVFDECLVALDRLGIRPPIVHASNTAAAIQHAAVAYGMIRIGIGMYGVAPSNSTELLEGMQPALSVKATVQRLARIEPGAAVGYGGTFIAEHPTRIALLPIGYADGYQRSLSGRAWAVWNGRHLPLAGRISMDQCSVLVPDDLDLAVGDEVLLAGDGSAGEPTIEQLAELAGTIGYEILTGLGLRLPVDYLRAGHVVARVIARRGVVTYPPG